VRRVIGALRVLLRHPDPMIAQDVFGLYVLPMGRRGYVRNRGALIAQLWAIDDAIRVVEAFLREEDPSFFVSEYLSALITAAEGWERFGTSSLQS